MTLTTRIKRLIESDSKSRHNNDYLRKDKITLTAEMINNTESWRPNDHSKMGNYRFQVIDFFSGCGGMSFGFHYISQYYPLFKILAGIDIDGDALASYQANYGAMGIQMDFNELYEDKNKIKWLSQKVGIQKNKPLIVIGCAPCQGFTSHRKKNWHLEDQRNTLIGKFAEVAVSLAPEVIIMENVPDIFSHKYWNHFEEFQKTLTRNGYRIKRGIFNAANFGVPQNRFRALIIAMKKEFLMPEMIIEDPRNYMTVRNAIENLEEIAPNCPSSTDFLHKCANHKESTINIIKQIPKNGGSRPKGVGPQCLDRINGFYDVYGRLCWNKPAITITRYSRNPASGRFIHPEQDRGLSMREAAILQSFPYSFIFKGNFDSIFKQIGEAVPPKLSVAVAVNTLIEILSEEPTYIPDKLNYLDVAQPITNSFSSVIGSIK